MHEPTVATRVAEVIRRSEGPVRQKTIVEVTGISKGSVSKAVQCLVAAGVVMRLEDGRVVSPGHDLPVDE
jgi:S-DNA-T family DNA segregation ATPase FtsK/SpoIIIE